MDYSWKNKYCFGTWFYACVSNIYINYPPVGQCVLTMGSYHKRAQALNAFVCCFPPHSERANSQKGECISLSCKKELCWHQLGSVRLSMLELYNFVPQDSAPPQLRDGRPKPSVVSCMSAKTGQSSEHVCSTKIIPLGTPELPHLAPFIIIFLTEEAKPSPLPATVPTALSPTRDTTVCMECSVLGMTSQSRISKFRFPSPLYGMSHAIYGHVSPSPV